MPYLLNVVYGILLVVFSPWLAWQAIRKGKYREGFAAKFLGRVPQRQSDRPCLWFHAVSVGELNLLAPLLGQIARCRPQWECVLSTTTATGMALAKKKYAGMTLFYCPLDFSWAVRSAVRRIRPDLVILAELELWPNLIRAVKESGACVGVVNGRLSERSARGYGRMRPLVARMLARIDLLAVQDETYAERFRRLGARSESVHVTGSMKYDGAQTDRNNVSTERLRKLAGFSEEDVVFLAGSTQASEEEMALSVFEGIRGQRPILRLVLVPRHPERFAAVARMLDQAGAVWQRRTDLDSRGPDPMARILLVDSVGELGAWWGTAQIAFVGGSMGKRGGQNMIEPAAYGAAVSFGPNTRNFRDIVAAMLRAKAAVVVHNRDDLHAFVLRCLEAPGYASSLGNAARALVASQLGATERTFLLLDNVVRRSASQFTTPIRTHATAGPVPMVLTFDAKDG